MAGSHFHMYRDTRGDYRWRLIDGNYKITADSAEGTVRSTGVSALSRTSGATYPAPGSLTTPSRSFRAGASDSCRVCAPVTKRPMSNIHPLRMVAQHLGEASGILRLRRTDLP